jgi:hypothetical protein
VMWSAIAKVLFVFFDMRLRATRWITEAGNQKLQFLVLQGISYTGGVTARRMG